MSSCGVAIVGPPCPPLPRPPPVPAAPCPNAEPANANRTADKLPPTLALDFSMAIVTQAS
jgi:hypothetical protein